MIKTKKRYSFWKVFWVVLGLNLIFTLLGFIALSVSPMYSKDFNWSKLLTGHYLFSQCLSIAFSSLFYYFAVNNYYKLFFERKSTSNFFRPTVIAILSLGAYFVLSYFLAVSKKITLSINDSKYEQQMTPALMLFAYIMSTLFYIGVSLLVAYLTHLRDERKQRKVLEAQKMQLEVEKSQANFNFLKAQINPHFLHNTLNFLYAKSLPYSSELSEGILTLSDIMRYALSEGNEKDGKAPLTDEIEHVRKVVKISQLRFSNKLNVNGNKLYFYCRNKKKTGPKELSTGIGLENIKNRLDLAYGKNYNFVVKD